MLKNEVVETAVNIAIEVGKAIGGGTLTTQNEASEKDDPAVGHHAIVTKEDIQSQTEILAKLAGLFPEALFLTEEKQGSDDPTNGKILTDANLKLIASNDVFIIDPLDGSSFRNRRLPGWSVSIGVTENGHHVGGGIYAPDELGSFSVYGDNESGAQVVSSYERYEAKITARERKKSVVFIGLDLHFLGQFSNFIPDFSRQVQTVSSTTCALGLAYLCAGKIDAFVQPVQCPWDWAAGYPLVELAGGKFQFYHYRRGFPEPMDKPDLASYSPTERNTAFIAGNPEIVDWLWELLCKTWRR